jgi:cytosolic carboxypeptidase protein 2/3
MINPDGVILGNSRCGASGKDLNREFKSRSKTMFPEVYLLKNLVEKIS